MTGVQTCALPIYTKAWKYYNKISKHIQISRNITFDQSDTKLYPIPDVNVDDEDMVPPKGEQEPHERVPITILSPFIVIFLYFI